MTAEQKLKPLIKAETASLESFLLALLDSHPLHPPIFGRLGPDGKTVVTKRGSFQADNVQAKPGDRVVVHEI